MWVWVGVGGGAVFEFLRCRHWGRGSGTAEGLRAQSLAQPCWQPAPCPHPTPPPARTHLLPARGGLLIHQADLLAHAVGVGEPLLLQAGQSSSDPGASGFFLRRLGG